MILCLMSNGGTLSQRERLEAMSNDSQAAVAGRDERHYIGRGQWNGAGEA